MKNNEPKSHHFVPRLYLRRFSHPDKRSGKNDLTYALRKGTKKIFETNIEKIACNDFFYSIDVLEEPLAWEKIFAKNIEPNYARRLRSLVNNCNSNVLAEDARVIDDELKGAMSFYITIQMVRGPELRDLAREEYPAQADRIAELTKILLMQNGMRGFDDAVDKIKYDEDIFKLSMAIATMNRERLMNYATILYNKTWVFYIIKGEKEWISSDSPIMLTDIDSFNSIPFSSGIATPNVIISFPISPKIMLEIYPWILTSDISANVDCHRFFMESERDCDVIKERNNCQFKQCIDVVYAHSKESLEDLI